MMIIGLVVVVYGRIKHVRSLAMPTRFLRTHAVLTHISDARGASLQGEKHEKTGTAKPGCVSTGTRGIPSGTQLIG